jgi:hypothetical protein
MDLRVSVQPPQVTWGAHPENVLGPIEVAKAALFRVRILEACIRLRCNFDTLKLDAMYGPGDVLASYR